MVVCPKDKKCQSDSSNADQCPKDFSQSFESHNTRLSVIHSLTLRYTLQPLEVQAESKER